MSFRDSNLASPTRCRVPIFSLILLVAGLLSGSDAVAAKALPSYLVAGTTRLDAELDVGGETYECDTEMDQLMDLVGDAWSDLPPEALDELMQALNRRQPCEAGGWDFLDDLGDLLGDIGDGIEDLGRCVYDVLSDVDDLSYETMVDAVLENGDSCWKKSKVRLQCDVREPHHGDPAWSCVSASTFSGSCISAADLEAAFASSDEARCLELDVDAVLCETDPEADTEAEPEVFNMTVYLTTDDVSLDCNGRTLTSPAGHSAIRAPYERSVSEIEILSCDIQSPGRYGIDLKRFFRGAELDGRMEGHRDIAISGTSIANSSGVGVYVGMNSRDVSLRDFSIRGAKVAGVYLEAGSTHSVISGGTISGTREKGGGADPGAAIAVDSSQHNTIENVTFSGNTGGDIKLYKNCGENFGQVCPVRRALGASHNVIRWNEFDHDVSVASRQFKLYGFDWCDGIEVAGYWRDHSAENAIYSNRFVGSKLDVQDGPNDICGNDFVSGEIELGKPQPLGFVDQSIEIDGVIAENAFDAESSIDVRTLGVFDDLDLSDNRDPDDRCLELPTVCTGADSNDLVERARYFECLDLRNACSARSKAREVAAAEACDVEPPATSYQGNLPGEIDDLPSSGSSATDAPAPSGTLSTSGTASTPATTATSTNVMATHHAPAQETEPEPAPSPSWISSFTSRFTFSLW